MLANKQAINDLIDIVDKQTSNNKVYMLPCLKVQTNNKLITFIATDEAVNLLPNQLNKEIKSIVDDDLNKNFYAKYLHEYTNNIFVFTKHKNEYKIDVDLIYSSEYY